MEEISVVEVSPKLVLGIRKIGGYEEIATLLPRLCEFAASRGIPMIGPPVFVCHEATVEESEKAAQEKSADVEVAIPIPEIVEDAGDIKCYELPGGRMAKILHKGPYEECIPTYERLFAWLEGKGKKIAGPIREVYLNDPREVASSEILTEIYAPIE